MEAIIEKKDLGGLPYLLNLLLSLPLIAICLLIDVKHYGLSVGLTLHVDNADGQGRTSCDIFGTRTCRKYCFGKAMVFL